MAQDHAALLRHPRRRGRALRGDRRQVHRRRDHGRVRRPGRPRGPRAPRLLRRPADARRRRRVRGRAAPRPRAQLLDPDRDQLRRGGGGGDRQRRRGRVHGDRPHGRARAADGGAGRARIRLPDRGHGGARDRLPRAEGAGRVRDQGREPAGRGLRAGRRRRGALAARPLPRARLHPLRRPRRGDGGRWRRRSPGRRPARARSSGSSPNPASARAASPTSSPSAAAQRGIEVFEAQAQSHGKLDPLHAGPADAARLFRHRRRATRIASSARRSPGGRCCSTRSSPRSCP